MTKLRDHWLIILAVIVGCLLLVAAFSYLRHEDVFSKPSGKPHPLTGYGAYSPVEIDGEVYFPAVSADGIAYERARRAQAAAGVPLLMSEAGSAPLPEDFLKELYTAFGKVDYQPDSIRDYDTAYLLVAEGGGTGAVCGVILRHSERFYLGNYDCEIPDELLPVLASALSALGEK